MSEQAYAERDPIDDAQAMAEWFSDYMYGLTNEVGFVPDTLRARIALLFGPDASVDEAVSQLRDLILEFADDIEDQTNAVLYTCGYPDEALARLGMGDTESTLRKIAQRFGVEAKLGNKINTGRKLAKPALTQSVVLPSVQELDIQNDKVVEVREAIIKATPRGKRSAGSRPTQELVGALTSLEDLEDDSAIEKWQDKSLCAQTDPEMFFPEKGGSTREAKRVCQGCEVRSECLEYAINNDERFGIWGGLSERERRRLKHGIVGPVATYSATRYEDSPLEARLIPKREIAKRLEQFFSIVCQGDRRDEAFEDEVSYDDELRHEIIEVVVDRLYRRGVANPDEVRLLNLRKYFSLEVFTGEGADWYVDNEDQLVKDLRGFDLVMRGLHEQYAAMQKIAESEEQPTMLEVCRQFLAAKSDDRRAG